MVTSAAANEAVVCDICLLSLPLLERGKCLQKMVDTKVLRRCKVEWSHLVELLHWLLLLASLYDHAHGMSAISIF